MKTARREDSLRSPNHDERGIAGPPEILVLHYTGMETGKAAIDRLCDPEARVSAHYVVEEDGTVFRLVPEERRAWHAGVSYWRGARDINARSIGIEIVNPGHEFGYRAFPASQMAAVCDLCVDIVNRRGITPWNVVGHSDIAPRRKTDPGELFDWRLLASRGVGIWPGTVNGGGDPDAHSETVARWLGDIGYEVEDLKASLVAFQRRFRPRRIDGIPDPDTMRLLSSVRALCP